MLLLLLLLLHLRLLKALAHTETKHTSEARLLRWGKQSPALWLLLLLRLAEKSASLLLGLLLAENPASLLLRLLLAK